jgi:hypothetical protein
MRTIAKLSLAATLFFCATGYTQCEYFGNTTVPSSDGDRPVNYELVWTGTYDALVVDGYEPMSYAMTDPYATVMAVSAAIDGGGVRKIRQEWAVEYECCQKNSSICYTESHQPTGSSEDVQSGGPGSTVSNGMWLAQGVNPSSYCPSNYDVDAFYFGWGTYAEDFFGHVRQTSSGRITYNR